MLSEDHLKVVRRVADFIRRETRDRLLDTATGMTCTDSTSLEPSASVIIESRFNAWNYQTLLVMEGMSRLGLALDSEDYRNFSPHNLDFIAHHLPYFHKQKAARVLPKPQGETPESRIGYYFDWDELWMTGLAPLWIARGHAAGDPAYSDYTQRFVDFVARNPRIDGGVLANNGSQVRTDDAYLMVPAMLRLAALEQSPARYDDAVVQMLGIHRRLFQKSDALYRHIWDAATDVYASAYWGRGNSWMALAWIEALLHLPATHPGYAKIVASFREQMEGVRRWQAAEGGWCQVMDHAESWIETSCTGMFVYALARGVTEGWLDESYREDADQGWFALIGKATDGGVLLDTCPSTGPGDLSHYLRRPQERDDIHAYGPFLMAAAEMQRLK